MLATANCALIEGQIKMEKKRSVEHQAFSHSKTYPRILIHFPLSETNISACLMSDYFRGVLKKIEYTMRIKEKSGVYGIIDEIT